MAIYRNIQLTFWTDTKVIDNFTPEDRYFYLYLLTNPHTTLCGCYEISLKQMSDETGYSKETIEKLLNRMETIHMVVRYDRGTKELLLFNWHKYNWTRSPKVLAALEKDIESVKNIEFKSFLSSLLEDEDTVSIPYTYPMDTTVTVTVTDTVADTVAVADTVSYFNDSELDELFNEFMDMRKKMKAVNSDIAIQRLVNKIHKLSNGNKDVAMEIIGQSIENSWKGVFPLKTQKIETRVSDVDDWVAKIEQEGIWN